MLVLSRRIGERLILSDPVTKAALVEIILCDIDRNKVRLGINTTDDVEIFREEILPVGYADKVVQNE